MPFHLPAPIAAYVLAENENDPNGLGQSFAIDATVHDEGQTFQGLTAIQHWMALTKEKYQHTVQPLAYVPTPNGGVVTMRLTGNFPGSPIEVKFTFVLEGDKIASLDIRS